MSDWAIIILLYLAGLLVFTAEIFIPSHGVLTVVGIGFLIAGVVKTFTFAGQASGTIAVLACLVMLPTFAVIAVKYWPTTFVGRRVAPPNPRVSPADGSIPLRELTSMIGRTGRCLTTLRPVGTCEFNGRRFSCMSKLGMIEAGATVEAIGISGGILAVLEKKA